jgi:hypothetical protein
MAEGKGGTLHEQLRGTARYQASLAMLCTFERGESLVAEYPPPEEALIQTSLQDEILRLPFPGDKAERLIATSATMGYPQ